MDTRLFKACNGLPASKGGLNATQFRSQLIKEFPRKEKRIDSLQTRKELEEFCREDRNIQARIKRQHRSPKPSKPSKSPKSPKTPKDYSKSGSKLSVREKKMCRCIAHVSAGNPVKCYTGSDPEWKKGPDSPSCRNPYAICRSRIRGVGKIRCYDDYDFRKMPENEVRAVKKLHGK